MKIPLIQYSVMKNAIKCFKYLLVNGYDDSKKALKEQNPYNEKERLYKYWNSEDQYEWDCMATAIYFGNKEIIKILEEKGFKKGDNPGHLKAAILSYRNQIAKEILEEIEEKDDKEDLDYQLSIGILAISKNNNIEIAEILIKKGANFHIIDLICEVTIIFG